MATMRQRYEWVAGVARLLPEATFHESNITYRDGRVRIKVIWNENEQTFALRNKRHKDGATPEDVYEHFRFGDH
jgi:hypothetical protein